MSKLGYTWYPKDWGNSDAVFELTLSERGFYRELIDMAMLNDNRTKCNINLWVRKFNSTPDEICDILDRLDELTLTQSRFFDYQDKDMDSMDWVFIPSCEPRLNLVRGGRKGGENKPTPKPIVKPTPKPIAKQKKEKGKEKEIREVLSELHSDKVILFKEWKSYRDDINKPIKTIQAFKLIVKKLNDEPLAKVTYVINNSIENGWQGLFWDKYDEVSHKPKKEVVPVIHWNNEPKN